ncbi:MAG: HIT family protein [Patescibacteria group bacterium]|jgi:histidine triad (HIT) family protein|nr:HIT family protein [Patescibacteria group bacterium]
MCLFCKIIEGEIPSYKIYESEKVFAFLDIKPVNPGHVLVVPKKHFANLEEVTPEYLEAVMLAVKKIAKHLKEKLEVPGYNLILNNDPVAGQEIPHLHFHIIPRKEDDGLKPFPQSEYEDGKAEEIIKKLIIE